MHATYTDRKLVSKLLSDVIEVQYVFNAEDNTPEGIKKRKEEAKKWIEEWRASQK